MLTSGANIAEVFISYARAGQAFARYLNNALRKLDRETWIDWRNIPDSVEWRAQIFDAIEAAENFVFIISPDSLRPESFCGLDDSFLLRGMELQEAVTWLAKTAVVKEPKPLVLQEEYIRASQEHESREVLRLRALAEQEIVLRKRAEEVSERQARRFRLFPFSM